MSAWYLLSILEKLFAGALLLLILPILVFASIIIVALSRRSPLVAHQRVGRYGRLIWVLKLRTMWNNDSSKRFVFVHRLSASEAPLLPPNVKNVRVTSGFAAFCRRYSLDELPQLWHVVQGQMSLVGPRPLTRIELDKYYGSDATRVLAARPGLSGLWQIRGRSRLRYDQRRRLDVFLVTNWSIPLYFRILLATVPRVLAGKDAW
jgi:exopolysaccharide production protein ExoY